MKIRKGFVSNSSSSSFVIMEAGEWTILESGSSPDNFDDHEKDGNSFDIDEIIDKLLKAKVAGATKVYVEHGGKYNG